MEKQLEPSLRFKEFDDDYKNYVLNDILELLTDFESNGSFASVKENVNIYEEKNFAWYVRATDLENKTGLDKVKYVDEHSYNFLRKTPLFGNELLITKRGEIGKVYFFKSKKDIKATVAPNMYLLKLNNLVDSKYVYYSFINNVGNKKLKRINASTTIGALYKDDVKSIKVIFPSIPEQQKIASFLTDVDDKITKLTQKKELLEQYKKGIMQKIFNQELRFKDENGNEFPKWEEKKLGKVCDVRDGTHDSPKYVKQGYPLITSKNLNSNGKLDFDDISFINELDYININKRSKVDIGDIIFGMIGTIGNPVLLKEDGFAIKNVALIKEKEELQNEFLIHFLKSNQILKQFHIENSGGTQKFVALGVIRNLKVLTPSIREQTKIADFLSDIDLKIEALNTKIENSKSFKKGLLQKMFV